VGKEGVACYVADVSHMHNHYDYVLRLLLITTSKISRTFNIFHHCLAKLSLSNGGNFHMNHVMVGHAKR
tara:strand:+ start:94 stop:300 length:207 start_codon:yes stop_codon:yes gene_type:complete